MGNTLDINAKTGLLGLLGNPVGHSVSPAIHGTLAKLYQKNYAYLAFQIEEGKLEDAVNGAKAFHVQGMNVTVPYKKAVMEYMTELDEKARVLGAVNTILNTPDGWKGFNTDMPGLQRAMAYDGVSVSGHPAVLLGAGGVANAIMGMLLEDGASEILIVNRNRENAEKLADHFRQEYHLDGANDHIRVMTYSDDYIGYMKQQKGWFAFQATSVGMFPKTEDVVVESPEFYRQIEVGYDMIFNPYETRFMQLVKQQGGKAFNGLRMLLFQGIQAFEIWMDVKVSEADAGVVLQVLKDELGIKE